MARNFTERPAIGTRVTLSEEIGDTAWYRRNAGKSGVVYDYRDGGGTVRVRFDDGEEDFGSWTVLTPEVTSPAPEITLNGHRYVLAETPAPEVKEERHEPKQGEIWGDGPDDLYLVSRIGEGTGYLCAIHLGSANRYSAKEICGDDMTFAYPSLAAAIEAGEKFD